MRGNRFFRFVSVVFLVWALLSAAPPAAAETFRISHYYFNKGPGDSWTYRYVQPGGLADFTVTITQINSGDFMGKWRIGDYRDADGSMSWLVISWTPDYFLIHAENDQVFDPPIQTPDVQPLDTVVSHPSDPDRAMYYTKLGQLTVPAGTFDDILLQISLDKRYPPNAANDYFGLDHVLVPYAVRSASWYGWKAGELQAQYFDVVSGALGPWWYLISTNVRFTPGRIPPLLQLLLFS